MQKSEFLISSIFGKMGNITKTPYVPSNLISCRLFSCFGASFDWSITIEGSKNEILRSNLVLTYATVKSGRNDSDVSFLQGTGRDVPSLPSPAAKGAWKVMPNFTSSKLQLKLLQNRPNQLPSCNLTFFKDSLGAFHMSAVYGHHFFVT